MVWLDLIQFRKVVTGSLDFVHSQVGAGSWVVVGSQVVAGFQAEVVAGFQVVVLVGTILPCHFP